MIESASLGLCVNLTFINSRVTQPGVCNPDNKNKTSNQTSPELLESWKTLKTPPRPRRTWLRMKDLFNTKVGHESKVIITNRYPGLLYWYPYRYPIQSVNLNFCTSVFTLMTDDCWPIISSKLTKCNFLSHNIFWLKIKYRVGCFLHYFCKIKLLKWPK